MHQKLISCCLWIVKYKLESYIHVDHSEAIRFSIHDCRRSPWGSDDLILQWITELASHLNSKIGIYFARCQNPKCVICKRAIITMYIWYGLGSWNWNRTKILIITVLQSIHKSSRISWNMNNTKSSIYYILLQNTIYCTIIAYKKGLYTARSWTLLRN